MPRAWTFLAFFAPVIGVAACSHPCGQTQWIPGMDGSVTLVDAKGKTLADAKMTEQTNTPDPSTPRLTAQASAGVDWTWTTKGSPCKFLSGACFELVTQALPGVVVDVRD